MKSKNELRKFYDEEYVAAFERHSTTRLIKILKHIDLNNRLNIVDYACGNGLLMELTSPKVKSYTGVDFSEPFIRAANLKKNQLDYTNATFFCSDISDFCRNFKSSFDVAFAMDFSEHVYDRDWISILREIRMTLNTAGKLYVHTPNAEFLLEILKRRNLILKQFPEHIAVRTARKNAELIEKAGYKVRNIWFIPHYNAMRYIHFMSYIPVVGKYFKARILIEASL